MIDVIIHSLYSGDLLTFFLCFVYLIYFIVLIIIYGKTKQDNCKLKIWKILCLVPLLISIIHFVIFTSGSSFITIFPFYKCIYIPSILMIVLPIVVNKKVIYKLSVIFISIIFCVSLFFSLDTKKVANYTRYSWSDAYLKLCEYFEDNYILNEWKKIDYNKLKRDGLSLVEDAEKTEDVDKYYTALDKFVEKFYDGHMNLSFSKGNDYYLKKVGKFDDYGLSLVMLDDGTVIAVNVLDNLKIKEGDIITKWNGVMIHEAIDDVTLPMSEGVIDNERILKPIFLAGIGDDKVDVTYINSNNEEETITLNKLNSKLPRAIKTMNIFNHSNKEDGYTYKMLDDNIAYLRIDEESTDAFNDYLAYLTGNHKIAREKFRRDLRKLKEEGMTKLVIDVRNNRGGYDEVATALTSLFTKDKMFAYSLGIKDKGKNKKVSERYVMGDGEFSDLEIVVLTNMHCASAGDGLVLYLSRLDNVKVIGLSNPSGINQETGGYVFMPNDVVIGFPIGLVLDEFDNPNIDIDYTRKSRTPLDIKIPLDRNGALNLFSGNDYELEWVVNYLNR